MLNFRHFSPRMLNYFTIWNAIVLIVRLEGDCFMMIKIFLCKVCKISEDSTIISPWITMREPRPVPLDLSQPAEILKIREENWKGCPVANLLQEQGRQKFIRKVKTLVFFDNTIIRADFSNFQLKLGLCRDLVNNQKLLPATELARQFPLIIR